MLYITTRSNKDAFTAHKTLTRDFAHDGGFYVPFQIPTFTYEEITQLKEKSFAQVVSEILNLFFSARISSWDVDCCIGRNPVKIMHMIHRITVAELWHNLGADYAYLTENLYRMICKSETEQKVTDWPKIAIRIATLFGLFGELMRKEIADTDNPIDIAVSADDFSVFMAAWYTREMGLPVNNIICCCQENSPVWDFIRKGMITAFAKDDISALERLISGTFDHTQALAYANACCSKRSFCIPAEALPMLNHGLFAAAVSTARIPSVINSVLRTDTYVLNAETAFVYGGLQDYRASTGENRPALLLADTPSQAAN